MPERTAADTRRLCLIVTALTWMVLCATPRAETTSTIRSAVSIESMIDCPLWVDALDRCLRPPSATGAGYAADLPPAQPDHGGIRRDTYYFLGLQFGIVGVLFLMPESVSGWSEEQKEQHRVDKWWNNVTDPTWDEDEHYINYVLHPYWGAAYYVRARERGFDQRGAFWYSVLLSTLYEGGVEAFFEPISIQDFFVTPIVGSWVGGYFMEWRTAARERMAASGDPRFRDRALMVMTDPLGNAADFVDRRLGRDAEFRAAPFVSVMSGTPANAGLAADALEPSTVYGVRLHLRW